MNAPSYNLSATPPKIQVIDLGYYWRLLMRFKWRIIAFSLAITLLAGFLAITMEPIYRSSVKILIKNEEANVLSIGDIYGLNSSSDEYFQTQLEILKSRSVAERVVTRMSLDSHPLFDPRQQTPSGLRALLPSDWWSLLPSSLQPSTEQEDEPITGEQAFDEVVIAVMDLVTIDPVAMTQIVTINFDSPDPELAAEVANLLAEVYMQSHMEANLQTSKNAAAWLVSRLEELDETLKASEQKLQSYREESGLIDVMGVQTLDAEELEQLTERFVEARNSRTQAQSILGQVNQLSDTMELEDLLAIPSVLSNPLVQSLRQNQALAEQRVAELSKRYGPKHPQIVAAETEAESTREQLLRQSLRVASGIEADYYAALQAEEALQEQISETKSRVQNINRQEFRLKELEREVQTNQQIYNMFLTRAKEIGGTGDFEAEHARIIDPAKTAQEPIKPNKKFIVAVALLISGFIASVVVILLDMVDKAIRSPDDVERILDSPLLGFLPLVKKNKSDLAYEGFVSVDDQIFAEAIRTIRTSLFLNNLDNKRKIVVVTSTLPNEGKSTVSLNLAEAMGQMSKVLLVEADMRRPTLARSLGLPVHTLGLSNFLSGETDLQQCIYKLKELNTFVLPAGAISTNPLEMLGSSNFAEALQYFSQHYDQIVFDCAPIHLVSDGLVLSEMADMVVYVVRADKTPAPLVSRSIARLKSANAPVSGVVLNMVDVKKAAAYGDYHAAYYGGESYQQS